MSLGKSFHQVSEILTKDKCRLSIGGWFHGSPYVRPQKIFKAEPEPLEPHEIDEDDFYSWINPMYLDLEIQTEISARFEDSSRSRVVRNRTILRSFWQMA